MAYSADGFALVEGEELAVDLAFMATEAKTAV
jgi:hypothetical protein